MADYAPPTGPPPPKAPEVPAGWTARWNEQYKEWFYVNVYTKKSQWEKPTDPVFPAEDGPDGPPPGYQPGNNAPITTDTKKNPYEEHSNDHGNTGGPSLNQQDEDAKLAAKLQAEEEARARGQNSTSPYNHPPQQSPNTAGGAFPQDLPPRERGKSGGGFLGKLLGKAKNSSSQQQQYGGGYPQQQQYGGGGYPQQQQQYGGGYPQGGYGGGYPQQPQYGYGGGPGYGPPPGGYGGGYGGGYQQQQQQRPSRMGGGGGMGMGGGLALGAGAGLLGGALLAHEFDESQQDAYQEGYQDGEHDDYGGGGDYDGGGDF